jgi:hypothetical protein
VTATQLTLDGVMRPHRNHGLFSDHFLDVRLTATQEWPTLVAEAASVFAQVKALWTEKASVLPHYSEAQLEDEFIRPVLRDVLGHATTVQPTLLTPFGHKVPDYILSASQADAVALAGIALTEVVLRARGRVVADAKKWGVKLDVAGASGGDANLTTNPSGQIAFYIRHTGLRWGILTDGRFWRLYHMATAHHLDRFYEVDLLTLIESDDAKAFAYFYAFFRADAFAATGLTVDAVLTQSADYATGVGDSLKTQVFGAVRHLAQGFLDATPTHLTRTPETLHRIYTNSLIVLYRLLFVAFAEARGLLPLRTNTQYRTHYSLYRRMREAAGRRESAQPLLTTTTAGWTQLRDLFRMIDEGSPPLSIGTFNGGLFDEAKHPFLVNHHVGDAHLDAAIDLLGRVAGEYVDYRDLATRHLGTIYEGLLEFHLTPLVDVEISDQGDVFTVALVNDAGERRSSGSFYTPDYIVEHIVNDTLGPLVDAACGGATNDEAKADRILALNVLDTAMGSAHFLVEATDLLARRLATLDVPTATGDVATVAYWRRRVAHACIYGVDINPLAVELAKLSLWLTTAAVDRPLSFLDHHLRCGNSLLGGRLADVQRRRALLASPTPKRRRTAVDTAQTHFLDSDAFQATLGDAVRSMIAIEGAVGQTVEEVKEQERAYEALRSAVEQRFARALDMSAAMNYGVHVDASLVGALFQHLTGGVSMMVSILEAVAAKGCATASVHQFFHWELEFPDVFFDATGKPLGDAAGFDAVVGNPPYDVLSARERGETENAMARFLSYARQDRVLSPVLGGKVDLFRLFLAQSLDLGRPGARAGFIVPMSLMGDQRAASLRQLLLTKHAMGSIHAFPQKDDERNRVFPDAKLPTCVVALTCHQPSEDALTVIVHPGRTFDQLAGQYTTTPQAIRDGDAAQWRIPVFTSNIAARLNARLPEVPGYCTIGDLVDATTGEIDEGYLAHLLREQPAEGATLVLRGSNVQRYRFVPEARQGVSKYLDVAAYRLTAGGARVADTQRPRLGYQRNSALDSRRRLLVTLLPTPCYCFDSIGYIPTEGVKYPFAVMALLNSDLLEWVFRQTSTNNHVSAAQLRRLPAVGMLPGMGRGTPVSELKTIAAAAQNVVASTDDTAVRALTSNVRSALARAPAGVDAALVALNVLAKGMLGVVTQNRDALEDFALDLEGVLPVGAIGTFARLWTPISARANTAAVEARRTEAVETLGTLADCALAFEDVASINEEQWKWLIRHRLGQTENLSATVKAFRRHHPALVSIASQRDILDRTIDTIVFDCFRVSEEERALVARELR